MDGEDVMTTRHIDSLESFEINGFAQWVLLRGDLATKRVLLIIQQGPGLPLIHEARVFEHKLHLEAETVVAYWDQRGTGKSYRAEPATISVAQSAADVRALVDALCARLNVERVDILGLSIGGTFATLAAARDPARIGQLVVVGLDVDWGESERYAYDFARAEAARRGAGRACGSSRPSARRLTTPRRNSDAGAVGGRVRWHQPAPWLLRDVVGHRLAGAELAALRASASAGRSSLPSPEPRS